MIRRLQNSSIPRDIGHRAVDHVISPIFEIATIRNLPQRIENLSPRDSRYHIHSKACSAPVRQFLHHLPVLRRVHKRYDGRARLQLIHLAHLALETGRPNLQQNVAFRPDCLSLSQSYACSLVRLVRELCFSSCTSLDEDALEALLEEQRGILRGDGYAPLVGVGLADDSNGELRVGNRGNGRYVVVGSSSIAALVPGWQDPRDAWTELLSLLIPLLRRTVERSNMASWCNDC